VEQFITQYIIKSISYEKAIEHYSRAEQLLTTKRSHGEAAYKKEELRNIKEFLFKTMSGTQPMEILKSPNAEVSSSMQ